MKKLLCIGLLQSIALLAQGPSLTTIVGPVYDSFGNLATTSFVVQSQARTTTGWTVTGTIRTVYVNNGVISAFTLAPNDVSVPNGTSYKITFANNAIGVPGGIWTCVIPTSSTPVAFSSACSPNSTPPTVGNAFPVSQIIPSSNNGDVLTTTNGISAWGLVPASSIVGPSTHAYLLESIRGVAGWELAGGHVHNSYIGHVQNSTIGHVLNSELGNAL